MALLVDARAATGASIEVSQAWSRFFSLERLALSRVDVLVASPHLSVTVSIAQLFFADG